jgi:O-antigen ligase
MVAPKVRISDKGIAEALIIAYLGTAPVYWLPWIPLEVWTPFKIVLYLLAVSGVLVLTIRRKQAFFPMGIFGLGGFILLAVFFLPGFLQAGSEDILVRVLDITFAAAFFWVIYNAVALGMDIPRIAMASAGVVALFNIPIILPMMDLLPLYMSQIDPRWSIVYTGLSGASTGWSTGISLYVPFLIYGATQYAHRRGLLLLFSALLLLLLAGQFVVGGRSGILSSLLIIVLFVTYRLKGRQKFYVLVAIMVVLAGLFTWIDARELQRHFRLDRLVTSGTVNAAVLDHFSAGRVLQYQLAVQGIANRPLLGHGVHAFQNLGLGFELHNVWLRLWYESGIMLLLLFVFMIVNSVRSKSTERGHFNYFARLCMYGGICMAFFEPSVLLGAFQNSAMWWLSFALADDQFSAQRATITDG